MSAARYLDYRLVINNISRQNIVYKCISLSIDCPSKFAATYTLLLPRYIQRVLLESKEKSAISLELSSYLGVSCFLFTKSISLCLFYAYFLLIILVRYHWYLVIANLSPVMKKKKAHTQHQEQIAEVYKAQNVERHYISYSRDRLKPRESE